MKLKLVQSRDEIKKDSSKLGQAVYDILSKEQAIQTAEETTEAMTPKYYEELLKAADLGKNQFESPFYVVVLRKKNTVNGTVECVLDHKYVRRQTKPSAVMMRQDFPNHDHDVYEIDSRKGCISYLWTLPTAQDCLKVTDFPGSYHPDLVKFIKDFNEGKLP